MNLASLATIREKVAVPGTARDEVHGLLAQAGAVLQGHFALQSGMHSDHIFRIRGFARHPEALGRLGDLLVARGQMPLEGKTLLCPESAGYLLADQLAKKTGNPLAVARVDLLRRPTHELVPRIGQLDRGSEVVIVNDVASSGASIDTLCELAQRREAKVVGVLVLATSRGSAVRAHLQKRGLAGDFLLEGIWDSHPAEACPQCRALDREILPVAEFN